MKDCLATYMAFLQKSVWLSGIPGLFILTPLPILHQFPANPLELMDGTFCIGKQLFHDRCVSSSPESCPVSYRLTNGQKKNGVKAANQDITSEK